jgi:hypothetical protein
MEFHIMQLHRYIIIFQDSNITRMHEWAVDALMELEFQKAGMHLHMQSVIGRKLISFTQFARVRSIILS